MLTMKNGLKIYEQFFFLMSPLFFGIVADYCQLFYVTQVTSRQETPPLFRKMNEGLRSIWLGFPRKTHLVLTPETLIEGSFNNKQMFMGPQGALPREDPSPFFMSIKSYHCWKVSRNKIMKDYERDARMCKLPVQC